MKSGKSYWLPALGFIVIIMSCFISTAGWPSLTLKGVALFCLGLFIFRSPFKSRRER